MRGRGAVRVRDQRVARACDTPAAVHGRSAHAWFLGSSDVEVSTTAHGVLWRGRLSRVILRDIVETDLPTFFEHQREPEGNALAAFPARDLDTFMKHWHERVLGNQANGKKTIVEDGQIAGNICSWDSDHHREIGYWLGKTFWGRGIATAAIAAYVKDVETKRPLEAFVASQNRGSIRALEKCGFVRVGEPVTEEDGTIMIHLQLQA